MNAASSYGGAAQAAQSQIPAAGGYGAAGQYGAPGGGGQQQQAYGGYGQQQQQQAAGGAPPQQQQQQQAYGGYGQQQQQPPPQQQQQAAPGYGAMPAGAAAAAGGGAPQMPQAHQMPSTGAVDQSHVIQIPNEFIGKVIGKGGAAMKEVMMQTGVKMNIPPDTHAPDRPIELIGNPQAIQMAEALIRQKINAGVMKIGNTGQYAHSARG